MHDALKAICSLPSACGQALHLGPRCTDNTRNMQGHQSQRCGLVCPAGEGAQHPAHWVQTIRNGTFALCAAKTMGTHSAWERGALSMSPRLPDATVGEDERVIFISAEPSCATFSQLGPFPGTPLEDRERRQACLHSS